MIRSLVILLVLVLAPGCVKSTAVHVPWRGNPAGEACSERCAEASDYVACLATCPGAVRNDSSCSTSSPASEACGSHSKVGKWSILSGLLAIVLLGYFLT